MNFINIFKATISLTVFFFVALGIFSHLEPTLASAVTDTVTVTQQVTSEITISAPANVTMLPAIAGMTGGTGNGTATWTVATNDTLGFSMGLMASTTPALKFSSYSFADYTEAAAVPDFTWTVAAADSEFGYTVEPATVADTVLALKDNGTACGGTATLNAVDTCWDGFTTSNVVVINRSSITTSSGQAEVVKFRAQSGASHFQEEGTYTATITATAVTN
jgi:hypothetical protein